MDEAPDAPGSGDGDAGWRVERTDDAAAFLAAAEPLLAGEPFTSTVVATVAARRVEAADRGEPRPAHPFWFGLVHDADGAPAGVAMRTAPFAPHPLYVLGMPDDAARALARDLLRRGEDVTAANGVLPATRVLVETLARAAGRAAETFRPTRLHVLGDLVPPDGVPGRARAAAPDEVGLVTAWFAAFHDDADRQAGREPTGRHGVDALDVADRVASGRTWLWVDAAGEPVSLAAHNPAVHGVARVGPVYTPPERRGHGYAAAVTAAVSGRLRAEGHQVCLFTDLDNPVSNRLYARLGFRPAVDMAELELVEALPRDGGGSAAGAVRDAGARP